MKRREIKQEKLTITIIFPEELEFKACEVLRDIKHLIRTYSKLVGRSEIKVEFEG